MQGITYAMDQFPLFCLILFQGVPASLTSAEELTEMLTVFIFISSVGHAAANFGQYDEYAFPPNYPSTLNCERPTTKVTLRKQSILGTDCEL